jgi:SAM-dependent methyltransferase
VAEAVHDPATAAYFDEHVPEYSTGRLAFAADFIREHSREDSAIVDIGCGAGNSLAYLRDATGVRDLCGIDVSERLLDRMRQEVPSAHAHLGSVLDRELVERIGPRFDFAVISAVLHHLIGRTRRESLELAGRAVHHAFDLLRPGGHLIVVDEAFSPQAAVSVLFWVKKGMSRITSRRVGLLGYWNNIGPPVVAYLSRAQLEQVAGADGRAELVSSKIAPARLAVPARWLLRKEDVTLVARSRPG